MEGVLVVAVCTKKDYMAVALPEHALADSCWVSWDKRSARIWRIFVQRKIESIREEITCAYFSCCLGL